MTRQRAIVILVSGAVVLALGTMGVNMDMETVEAIKTLLTVMVPQ